MTKPCVNCGATSGAEARFCRACGTPLTLAASGFAPDGDDRGDGNIPVSPLAQTVPLTNDSRCTDGLFTNEARRSPETGKVKHTELEDLLRRPLPETSETSFGRNAPQPSASPAPPAVFATAALPVPLHTTETALIAAPPVSDSVAISLPAKAHERSRRKLPLIVSTSALSVACIAALSAALIVSRRHTRSGSTDVSVNANRNEQTAVEAQTIANDAARESVAQPPNEDLFSPPINARDASSPTTQLATKTTPAHNEQVSANRRNQQRNQANASPASTSSQPLVVARPTPSAVLDNTRDGNAPGVVPNSADRYYEQALKTIGGRNIKALKDGEVAAALNYMLRVTDGAHKAQAKAMADELYREYEQRKKNFRR